MVAFTAGAVLTAANLNTAFNALTFRAVTGTSDTFVLADNGGAVSYSNASPITATVPPFSSVAYANGTTIQLLNLGAGVVTVTAGVGVTINGTPVTLAQNVGGRLIKTATNTWYFLPGASASGMDLITPTSVAGSGVTLSGGAVSFSSSTTVSVNGCFTAAYDNYIMDINVDSIVTTSNYITGRLRAAGTDVSTSTYNFQNLVGAAAAVNASQLLSQTSFLQLSYATVGQSTFGTFKIFNPARAIATHMHGVSNESTSAPAIRNTMNVNTNATAYDGISFLCATAITGTLRIYGLRNS